MTSGNHHTQNTAKGSLLLTQTADTAPVADTVTSYYSFLQDSLNPPLPDTTFRFELREIILPATESPEAGPAYNMPSLFTSKQEKPVKREPLTRYDQGFDWLTIALLASVALLAWIRFYHSKRLRQLFRAVYARHHVNQLVRDGNLTKERITIGLIIIYLITVSTLIVKLAGSGISNALGINYLLPVFLLIVLATGLLWALKLLIIRSVGILFRTKQTTDEYLLSNIMFNTSAGLIALPFVIAWNFTGHSLLLYITIAIFLILMTMRMLRNFFLGFAMQSFSVVYLFLYLCTLEILPYLVAYKYYTLLSW